MNRILIIGKNSELARDAFSRTACRSNPPGSSHAQATWQAVLYSGRKPDSAPGGPRRHLPSREHTREVSASQPYVQTDPGCSPWLGSTWRDIIDCAAIAVIGFSVVALMCWAAI
jgi:hypothetical protein